MLCRISITVRGKRQVVLYLTEHHVMKTASSIFNYMAVSGQLHEQASLFPQKEPQVPLGCEAG
jgi:hypothetical protein